MLDSKNLRQELKQKHAAYIDKRAASNHAAATFGSSTGNQSLRVFQRRRRTGLDARA